MRPFLVGKGRRSHRRYGVALELHCKLIGSEQFFPGETSDINSGGVRFHVQETFPVGATVELLIKWPTPWPDTFPLKLVLEGRVVHSDESRTAVQTLRYRFGTRTMTAIREPITGKADTHIA